MKTDWPAEHPYRVMRGLSVPLLFGVLTYSDEEKYPYNSAYMMEPDGRITARFDKNYLLIFGDQNRANRRSAALLVSKFTRYCHFRSTRRKAAGGGSPRREPRPPP